jgi:SWI/SNF-related matrix-associated actin-dependent regulator of chromatin subfamily A member 5
MHTESQLAVFKLQMGLGKTLQTISLLAYLRESRGVRGPHIVIVPKSVVGNWIREFKKWCPCIKAVKMGGTKEERQKVIAEDLPLDPVTGKHKFDVLVTSRTKDCLGKRASSAKSPGDTSLSMKLIASKMKTRH